VERLQDRIEFEEIPPGVAPTLIDRPLQCRQRFLLVALQCVDLHISDAIALATEERNLLDVLEAAFK
jgi:hypothetical protein